jgi:hypothetical protein
MPIECFVDPEEKYAQSPLNHLSTMKGAVANVHNLSVCFGGRVIEHMETYGEDILISEELSRTLAKNISSFISSMPLRTLNLYFNHFTETSWGPFVLGALPEFYDLTFPYLQSLTIEGHPVLELPRFLSRHSSTLRNLIVDARMFHISPQEVRCLWKETMTSFRDNLKLDSFRILFHKDDDYQIDGSDNSNSRLLEEFVLGAGSVPWPEDPRHTEEDCHLTQGWWGLWGIYNLEEKA